MSIGARLREERERLKKTQTEFAELAGASPRTQISWEQGGSSPSADYLAKMAEAGTDVNYVITGRRCKIAADVQVSSGSSPGPLVANSISAAFGTGSTRGTVAAVRALLAPETPPAWTSSVRPLSSDNTRIGGSREGPPRGHALLPVTEEAARRPLVLSLPFSTEVENGGEQMSLEYELVPRIVEAASAGKGAAVTPGIEVKDLVGEMAFSFEWLRHNLGNSSGNIASIRVVGDSMAPTLLDGDTIIIDCDVRQVQHDAIYVLDIYGQRIVKRVRKLFDTGGLELISDNDKYGPQVISRAMATDVLVLGRMIWPRTR